MLKIILAIFLWHLYIKRLLKMGVAWAISIFYIKQPQTTLQVLQAKTLDKFTHNKSIQKICESYRVSKEDKESLKLLRI